MDKISNAMRASLLTQAVPYIKKYAHTYVVVKYGGNAMTDEGLKKSVMEDILLLHLVGVKVVLVHGGGPEINRTLDKMAISSHFVDGLRVTSPEVMDVVQMVLAGKVNKDLVSRIQALGGKAVGICGLDGALIRVHQQSEALGLVGEIDHIQTDLIDDLVEKGYIPVISSIGLDEDGKAYNINADTAAAQIAGALQAKTFVTLTNVDGVLLDKDDAATLVSTLSAKEANQFIDEGTISGGMIPKIACCLEAIQAGAEKVCIINGEVPHAILIELLTDEGLGTMVTP